MCNLLSYAGRRKAPSTHLAVTPFLGQPPLSTQIPPTHPATALGWHAVAPEQPQGPFLIYYSPVWVPAFRKACSSQQLLFHHVLLLRSNGGAFAGALHTLYVCKPGCCRLDEVQRICSSSCHGDGRDGRICGWCGVAPQEVDFSYLDERAARTGAVGLQQLEWGD